MSVCPVGVIVRKREGFRVPIGERRYDAQPVSATVIAEAQAQAQSRKPGEG
jgi:[NiFe] hydrogenase diaphorase moiety small subunit